jgi:hypothetical protein
MMKRINHAAWLPGSTPKLMHVIRGRLCKKKNSALSGGGVALFNKNMCGHVP